MAYNAGASSGNLVLIQKQVASNVASVAFTTGITGYDVYYLSYYGVTIATNAQDLYLQLSTNGGSSYSNAGYTTYNYISYTGGLIQAINGATIGIFLAEAIDNTTTNPCMGNCYLNNFGNSSFNKSGLATFSEFNGSQPLLSQSSTYWATSTVVNAFQIIPQAGNILTGTFKLYGVQN